MKSGKFEIAPHAETIIPVSVGRGPYCFDLYRALRIVRRFRNEIGMDCVEVEVESVKEGGAK